MANGIFTQKLEKTLALNGQPIDWQEVALQVNTEEAGNYQISIEMEHYDHSVFLRDTQTGEIVDLTQTGYSFQTQSGITNDRFQLLSNPSELLAAEEEETLIYAYESNLYIHSKEEEKKTYQLVTISGREVLNVQTEGRSTIDLSHLSKGIYLVLDGNRSTKIILN